MDRFSLLLLLVLLIGPTNAESQFFADRAIPGDSSAMPENPALMIFEQPESFVSIRPEWSTESGSLHRWYDPGLRSGGSLNAEVVRVLGIKGTFRGSASYGMEHRGEVYSVLRMEPYAGDPFLPVDTMRGAFLFTGPRMQFEYAYELATDLTVGFMAAYRVADGLKEVYSNSHTIRRGLAYGAGVAYAWGDDNLVHLHVRGTNDQESIESKSNDDLTEIEIFSYRGDTYAIRRRSQSVTETFRMKGWGAMTAAHIGLSDGFQVEGYAGYEGNGLKSMFPSSGQVEFEDGYGQLQRLHGRLGCSFMIAEGVRACIAVGGERIDHWSKVSTRSLLLWEWNMTRADITGDIRWMLSPGLILDAGIAFGSTTVDSTKHIDTRSTKETANPIGGGAGVCASVFSSVEFTMRCEAATSAFDPLFGGRDLATIALLSSLEWPVTEEIRMSAYGRILSVRGQMSAVDRARTFSTFGLGIRILQQ